MIFLSLLFVLHIKRCFFSFTLIIYIHIYIFLFRYFRPLSYFFNASCSTFPFLQVASAPPSEPEALTWASLVPQEATAGASGERSREAAGARERRDGSRGGVREGGRRAAWHSAAHCLAGQSRRGRLPLADIAALRPPDLRLTAPARCDPT